MVLYYCSSIRSSIATTSAKVFPFHDPSQRSDIFWPELSAGRKDEEKKKKKKKKKDVGNEVGGPSEWYVNDVNVCECEFWDIYIWYLLTFKLTIASAHWYLNCSWVHHGIRHVEGFPWDGWGWAAHLVPPEFYKLVYIPKFVVKDINMLCVSIYIYIHGCVCIYIYIL